MLGFHRQPPRRPAAGRVASLALAFLACTAVGACTHPHPVPIDPNPEVQPAPPLAPLRSTPAPATIAPATPGTGMATPAREPIFLPEETPQPSAIPPDAPAAAAPAQPATGPDGTPSPDPAALAAIFAAGGQITGSQALYSPGSHVKGIWLSNGGTLTAGLLQRMAEVKTIESLGLRNVTVSDAVLRHLADLKSLRELTLLDTSVTDAQLARLKTIETLTSLDISSENITDKGLHELTAVTSLTRLRLTCPAITAAGVNALAALPHLADLAIFAGDITPADCPDLAKQCASRGGEFSARPAILPAGFLTARLDLPTRDVHLQTLPPEVADACVAPDGRVWYTLRSLPGVDPTLNATARMIERRIEAECNRPDPQIFGVRILLFQKDGPIWFTSNDGSFVLRFDPSRRQWLSFDTGSVITADPPGHVTPRLPTQPEVVHNLELAGSACFPSPSSLMSYDGTTWTSHPFATYGSFGQPLPLLSQTARIIPEPDGRGVTIALTKLEDRNTGANTDALRLAGALWHLRDDRWTSVPLAGRFPPGQNIAHIVLLPDGRLILATSLGDCFHINPRPAPDLPAHFATLLPNLSADSFAAREKAQHALIDLGPTALPFADRALANAARLSSPKSADPELRSRLTRIIDQLATAQPQVIPVGPYRIRKLLGVFQQPDSPTLLAVELDSTPPSTTQPALANQPPPAPAQGLLILSDNPRATPRFLDTSTLNLNFADLAAGLHASLPDPARVAIFLGVSPLYTARPSSIQLRLDLSTPQPTIAPLAPGTPGIAIAVTPSGDVFLRQPSGSIALLQRRIPDTRLFLHFTSTPVAQPRFCVASDGKVYVADPQNELLCFDGKSWATLDALDSADGAYLCFIPGAHGEVFACTPRSYFALIHDGAVDHNTSLSALIKDHRDLFRNAFAGATHANYGRFAPDFAVDASGNIWLLSDSHIQVLAKDADDWQDLTLSIPLPDDHRTPDNDNSDALPDTAFTFLSAVGDSSRIYVTDAQSRAFLISLDHGQPHFTPAPVAKNSLTSRRPFRDSAGGLWLLRQPATTPYDNAPDCFRLTEKGLAAQTPGLGPALLQDQSGYLWFANPTGACTLWRDGHPRATALLPADDRGIGFPADQSAAASANDTPANLDLVSDRPNSVYAFTSSGIHHFLLSHPLPPATETPHGNAAPATPPAAGPAATLPALPLLRPVATYVAIDDQGVPFINPASLAQNPVIAYSKLGYFVTATDDNATPSVTDSFRAAPLARAARNSAPASSYRILLIPVPASGRSAPP